jgi:hypothetical protein
MHHEPRQSLSRRIAMKPLVVATTAGTAAALLTAPTAVATSAHARLTVHASARIVAGIVVNSQNRPLRHLPIAVDGHTPSGRTFQFRARTNRHGRFRLGPGAGRVNAVRWTATANFRWYGGIWQREMNTVSNRPSRLRFRADVVSRGRDSLASGVFLRVDDWDGCNAFNPNDPRYVATDPHTQSINVHLAPARRLVDGTRGRPGTVTLRSGDLCGFEGEGHQIVAPAGAWKVTGVTNHGRRLAFSKHLGSGPYDRSLTVFNFPMPHGDLIETIDVHFAK